MMLRSALVIPALALLARAETIEFADVVSKHGSRTIELPAEIAPFLTVALHAKVPGYVERVLVDRGSVVKEGQLLIELSAPEMQAQIAQAESKFEGRRGGPAASRSPTLGCRKHLPADRGGGQDTRGRRWQ